MHLFLPIDSAWIEMLTKEVLIRFYKPNFNGPDCGHDCRTVEGRQPSGHQVGHWARQIGGRCLEEAPVAEKYSGYLRSKMGEQYFLKGKS